MINPNLGSKDKVSKTECVNASKEPLKDLDKIIIITNSPSPLDEDTDQEIEESVKGNASKEATMENLLEMITNLTTTVNSIKNDITDLKTSKSTVDILKNDLEQEKRSLKLIKEQHDADAIKIKMLSAIVIRQDQKIDHLSSQIEFLIREQKKPNFFIEGILEKKVKKTDQDRKQLVKDFIKEELEIETDVNIKQVYRIGKKNT